MEETKGHGTQGRKKEERMQERKEGHQYELKGLEKERS